MCNLVLIFVSTYTFLVKILALKLYFLNLFQLGIFLSNIYISALYQLTEFFITV